MEFEKITGGMILRRLFLLFAALVLLMLAGCGDPLAQVGETGIVRLRITFPGEVLGFLEEKADSFAVLIQGIQYQEVVVANQQGSESLELSLEIPGDKEYDLYLMGLSGEILNSYGLLKAVKVSCGEILIVDVKLKTFMVSWSVPTDSGSYYLFNEPPYDDEAENVKWRKFYTNITVAGMGFGEFLLGATADNFSYRNYSFDAWKGHSYYLHSTSWYESLPDFHYGGFTVDGPDTVMRESVEIYCPVSYVDDGRPYLYGEAQFEVRVPLKWGELEAGLLCSAGFSQFGWPVK